MSKADLMSFQKWTKQDRANQESLDRFFKTLLKFSVFQLLEDLEIIIDENSKRYIRMLGVESVWNLRENYRVLMAYRNEHIIFKPGVYKDWYAQIEAFYEKGAESLSSLANAIYGNENLSNEIQSISNTFHKYTREELEAEWEYTE